MTLGVTFLLVSLIAIFIWVSVEVKRMRHKIFAIFLILLLLFGYFSVMVAFKGKEIEIKTLDGFRSAMSIYFSFLSNIGGNLAVLTSNAIKMDWTAEINKTVENE